MHEPALPLLHLREMPHFERRGEALRIRAVESDLHPPRLAGEKVEEIVREGGCGRVRVQAHKARVGVRAHLHRRLPVRDGDHLCGHVRIGQAQLVLAHEERGAALYLPALSVTKRRGGVAGAQRFRPAKLIRGELAHLYDRAAFRPHGELARIHPLARKSLHSHRDRAFECLRPVIDDGDRKPLLVRHGLDGEGGEEVL